MSATGNNLIDIRPVTGALGAEIAGVWLAPDLGEDLVGLIRSAILEHGVVFIRGQEHLDDNAQAAFAQRLGELTTAHPAIDSAEKQRSILPIDSGWGNRAHSWHTDVTFVDRPPSFSLLRAVVLPPYGGDTSFASTVNAYRNLPPQLRDLSERLWAVHTNDYDYATSHASEGPTTAQQTRYGEQFTSTVYKTEHPVVRVHPETGERALLLGHFAQRFVGFNGVDSRHLFDMLQGHIVRLENTVRWRWAPGDLAIWDNRLTQHYAVSDYGDVPRLLHRVTVAGEVPVSVFGEYSVSRQGDATAYSKA